MKRRITSTVIISILVLINLFIFTVRLLPVDPSDFAMSLPEHPGEVALLWGGLAFGITVLVHLGWMANIAITHAICLIFTVKNRRSPIKAVRVINLALDAANVFLIVAPIIRIIQW